MVTIDAAQVAARALAAGDISSQGLAAYQQRAEQTLHRRLARSHRLRERFSPDQRASRGFVRLFAVAAGGK